jgi:hypothetical protein
MLPSTGAVEGFAGLVQPWASLYADHRWLQTTITFAHLSGIFLGGGFAMATDRDTFIAMSNARLSGQIRHLGRIRSVHKPVMLGLVLALTSGFLLFLADVEQFSGSVIFWVKMALLAALLTNGYLLKRTEEILAAGDPDSPVLWSRLWKISVASMVLWLSLILLGTLLAV